MTETAGYIIQIYGTMTPHKDTLLWSFHVKSKDKKVSTSGHNHGQTREDVENYAFAWMGVRSVARMLGMRQIETNNGWDMMWTADAEL